MDINTLKLAAYLDEAGEEPDAACRALRLHNIHYVALRHTWTDNICKISDVGHQRLSKIIAKNDITVIMIASELGRIDVQRLPSISDSDIDHVINVAKYYRALYVRIFAGIDTSKTAIATHDYTDTVKVWMNRIAEKCAVNNITPILEIIPDAYDYKAPDVAQLLIDSPTWRLLYDPVSIVMKHNIDPFTRYWTLLKQYTVGIDIRDIKIGKGFKPPGFGDSRIDMTIRDALDCDYRGWFFLEPTLGRRYNQSVTKSDTFKFAVEGLNIILKHL